MIQYNHLGHTSMKVSHIGYGAAALGDVYDEVDEDKGIETVHQALENGINYFDTSPYYGFTKSESRLGRALEGYPREKYYLSTKTGRTGDNLEDFDYTESNIRRMVEASLHRLKVDFVDILFLHDIEYFGGEFIERALSEGLNTLQKLKEERLIRYIGVATYPVNLIKRIIREELADVILCHNHYNLLDQQFVELKELADQKDMGMVNASALASGVLTQVGPRDWHPATKAERRIIKEAVAICNQQGWPIEKLGIQYVLSSRKADTTLISVSSKEQLKQILDWNSEPANKELTRQIQQIIKPLHNKDWQFGQG